MRRPPLPPPLLTQEEQQVSLTRRLLLPLLQFTGAGVSIMLQWVVLSEIGPIATTLGAATGAAVFFGPDFKSGDKWLNRPRLLSLAVTTFFGMGLLGAAFYAWSIHAFPQHMGNVAHHPAKAAAAFGLMSAMLGGILTIIVGDLVAWRVGGYGGEPPLKPTARQAEDDDED